MRTTKKILAALLALTLLFTMAAVTASAEESASVIDKTVLHSITTEEKTGNGLAFRVTMNVKGAAINDSNEFINENATAVYNGVEYSVVKMGAVLTNQAAYIPGANEMTLADVNTERTVLDIPAKRLCAVPEADSCTFAVRIIKIPAAAQGNAIACRPYCVLQDGEGNEFAIYGDADICTYNTIYYTNEPAEMPVLDLSALGGVDDKIVATASAEYVNYTLTTYKEAFKVTLSLTNTSANAKTSAGDAITYSFKDADGNEVGTQSVGIDAVAAGESKTVEFYAPIATASIQQAGTDLTYVPDILLPAIGSDIDVTKKKNRIRVSAATASFNEDGSIHVSLTFKNYTSNWITEETDYVQYTYYNAAGTKIKTVTLFIGVIDTKKNPVKTFEFDLPDNAASVQITKSKIVYWTEWA